MKKLRIANIKQDQKLTPRSSIDKATVATYAASYDQLPPVDVFWIEGRDGWWLVDGNHRLEAAKSLRSANGKPTIKTTECNDHQGTFDDALEFAYDSNLKHGKPLNQKERKAGAVLKLKLHSERSNTWIAEDCGIGPKTVIRYREELEAEGGIAIHDKLLDRSGRWQVRHQERNNNDDDKPHIEINLFCGDMLKLLKDPLYRMVKSKNGKPKKELVKFDLLVTDPPYGVNYSTVVGAGRNPKWDDVAIKRDSKKWLKAIIPHLKAKYHLFWFCSPTFAADIEIIFRELGLPIQSRIVWHRRNMAKGSQAKDKFIDTWEMCFHIGNKPLNFDDVWSDAWFDVQTHAVPQTQFKDQKLHPTQKPKSLITRLVQYGSDYGDNVLDPFAGSGTTGLVCQELERNCMLVEIEEEYIGVIQARLGILEESKKDDKARSK